MGKKFNVVVDGTVGVGKSTLANIMEQEFQLTLYPEPVVDNPMLELFYDDRKRYSFATQVFFLNSRFEHIKQVARGERTIQDRSIYGDEIFARMLYESGDMMKQEFDTYHKLLQNMLEHVEPPNLIVYLQTKVETAVERIATRGRGYELAVEQAYWEDLNERYESFFRRFDAAPVLTIDVSNLDFQNVMEDRVKVLEEIRNKASELGLPITTYQTV